MSALLPHPVCITAWVAPCTPFDQCLSLSLHSTNTHLWIMPSHQYNSLNNNLVICVATIHLLSRDYFRLLSHISAGVTISLWMQFKVPSPLFPVLYFDILLRYLFIGYKTSFICFCLSELCYALSWSSAVITFLFVRLIYFWLFSCTNLFPKCWMYLMFVYMT